MTNILLYYNFFKGQWQCSEARNWQVTEHRHTSQVLFLVTYRSQHNIFCLLGAAAQVTGSSPFLDPGSAGLCERLAANHLPGAKC